MKNKNKRNPLITNHGMTLTELIVSGILISIMMVTVVSFNFAMKNLQKSTGDATLLEIEATAIITRFTTDASMAIGDSTDPGIIVSTGADWIGFRIDLDNTPGDYTDDSWRIYEKGTVMDPYILSYCTDLPASLPGGLSVTYIDPVQNSCPAEKIINLTNKMEPILTTFEFVNNPATLELYSRLNLVLVADPSKVYHPINNPNYQADIKVTPSNHGW